MDRFNQAGDGAGRVLAHKMRSLLPWAAGVIASTVVACQPASVSDMTEAGDPVLVGAGDIAECGREQDEATAALLDEVPGTVFTLGDNAQGQGTSQEFEDCFAGGWGRHRDRMKPAVGNHEYLTSGAAAYFAYFGEAAGEAGKGWYSYNLGAWHIVVLNSECNEVGGCDADSEQGKWLEADLEADSSECLLAYWHTPRFSQGGGFNDQTAYFWQLLYEHGAEVILNGHDHFYTRFSPQNPAGEAEPLRGIRQFTVGTGGAELYGFEIDAANVEVRNRWSYGVLKLTLHPSSYEWQFISTNSLFTDTGDDNCH